MMAKVLNQTFVFCEVLYEGADGLEYSTGAKFRETLSIPTDFDDPDGWKWIKRSAQKGIPSRRGGGAVDLDSGWPP